MSSRKYSSLGLRRDSNLSDVEDQYQSLSNLLNDLIDSETERFIPEDIVAINGLRNTDITTNDLLELAGQNVTITDTDNIVRNAVPAVTIKDSVEISKVYSGDPPFMQGGDGINAIFVPSTALLNQSSVSSIGEALRGDDLIVDQNSTEGPFNYWSRGIFEFGGPLFSEFTDEYGLIQWEGYITQSNFTQNHIYSVNATGLFLIELDLNDDGNWETLSSVYNNTRTINIGDITVSGATVTFSDNSILRFLAENDRVVSIDGTLVNEELIVEGFTIRDNIISDSSVVFNRDVSAELFSGNTIEVESTLGDSEKSITNFFKIPDTYYGDKLKIRISLWWPIISNGRYGTKYCIFGYRSAEGEFLAFPYLYSKKPEGREINPLSMEYFYKSRLDPWNRSTNAPFTIDNSTLLQYDPPILPNEKYRGAARIYYNGKGKFVDADSAGSFANIERGDYIFYGEDTTPSRSTFIQVSSVIDSNLIEAWFEDIDNLPDVFLSSSGASPINVDMFSYKGLVFLGRFTASELLSPATLTNGKNTLLIDDVENDHILITNLSDSTYRVSELGNSKITEVTENALPLFTDNGSGEPALSSESLPTGSFDAAIYRDRGLEDRSKDVYCSGVSGRRLNQTVSAGSVSIQVDTATTALNDGLSVGQYVQFDGIFPSNTTIQSISVSGSNVTIGLSQAALSTLMEGNTVTISPDDTNREICIVALDTAPPFVGTATGLETAQGNEAIKANRLAIKELKINTSPSNILEMASGETSNYSETLEVTYSGDSYKFLIA